MARDRGDGAARRRDREQDKPNLLAVNVLGELWTVDGRTVVVRDPATQTERVFSALREAAGDTLPRNAVLSSNGHDVLVTLNADGTVTPHGDVPAATAATAGEQLQQPAPEAGPAFAIVSAHHGSGASTWAHLLGAPETTGVLEDGIYVVGVCRSTTAGVAAAKALIQSIGRHRVRAFLVVADAPGSTPPAARNELRVLAGAVHLIHAPWFKPLRGIDVHQVTGAYQSSRPLQRFTAATSDALARSVSGQ